MATSYAYDPTGKKIEVKIVDGKTYLADGSRVPIGYTVETNGGIYKMTDQGGVKVDSHNTAPAPAPTPTSTTTTKPSSNWVTSGGMTYNKKYFDERNSDTSTFNGANYQFDEKYKGLITNLANANGVDMKVAADMLKTNLDQAASGNAAPYSGGGVVDSATWSQAINDYKSLKELATSESANIKQQDVWGNTVSGTDILNKLKGGYSPDYSLGQNTSGNTQTGYTPTGDKTVDQALSLYSKYGKQSAGYTDQINSMLGNLFNNPKRDSLTSMINNLIGTGTNGINPNDGTNQSRSGELTNQIQNMIGYGGSQPQTGDNTKVSIPKGEELTPYQPQQTPQHQSSYTPMSTGGDQLLAILDGLNKGVLSYEQAKQMANEQLGNSYDKALADTLKNIDRQSLQTGFFGQLPTVDYKQRNASEIEMNKQQAISQLAQQLMDDSESDAFRYFDTVSGYKDKQWEKGFQERAYKDSRSDTAWQQNMQNKEFEASRSDADWEKLFKERQYVDSRGDINWEKLFQERNYLDSRDDATWEKLFKERGYIDSRGDMDWEKLFKEREYLDNTDMAKLDAYYRERGYIDSRGDVDWEKAFKEREYSDNRGDVDWEKAFKEREYSDNRGDVEWEKDVTESGLTGLFRGSPTMAMTELAHQIGLDNKKMQMAEVELNQKIAMDFENLKNDKIQLSQAWARIGQANEQNKLDAEKFMASIKEQAWKQTIDEFDRKGIDVYEDDLGFMSGDNKSGTSGFRGDVETELISTWSNYIQQLLNDPNNTDGLLK